jgi:pyrimidine-specific ribonucleoside hydrolase
VVHAGAASSSDLGKANDAVMAMADALSRKPMTILALGPLTNVGSLLKLHPELHDAIEGIVIVAARREGQVFNYPTARSASLPDFNFENDPEAVQIILDSDIDIVFTPWEVSSYVWLTVDDLVSLASQGGSGAWIAEKSAGWIAMWLRRFQTPGFNPFDTLAVAWATHPHLLEAIPVSARIEYPVERGTGPDAPKPRLLVTPGFDPAAGRRIDYAYRPAAAFKPLLLRRLAP